MVRYRKCYFVSYKNNDETYLGNYRLTSVIPCFWILKIIVDNQLHNELNSNNILYKKNIDFQKGHFTKHAILQLFNQDQVRNSFELFTLSVFIDLSKAFDGVAHDILICKLKNYEIRRNNLKWFN